MAKDKTGQDAMLPADPCFILGNHRMTLFAHVSGKYELITGERGWARLNHGGKNLGQNQSGIRIMDKSYELTGEISDVGVDRKQVFGTGYACYQYTCPEMVQVTKRISVLPSLKCGEGNSAFFLEVAVENRGKKPITVDYWEKILANYQMMTHQDEAQQAGSLCLAYRNLISLDEGNHLLRAEILPDPVKLLVLPENPQENYAYDCFPPSLFFKALESEHCHTEMELAKDEIGDWMGASFAFTLQPGGKRNLGMVIGFQFHKEASVAAGQVAELLKCQDYRLSYENGAYGHLWKKALPVFEEEAEEVLRMEMIWNAYVLECMATYHQYFNETFIPQGSVYAYHLGQNASNRDHLQHLLPLIYINPPLAKSCLRFAMKHTLADGEICRQDIGYGYRDPGIYMESDAQLYMFMAVGEYLRVTKDYHFLQEEITYYPVEYGKKETVIRMLVKHFIYLRDTVRTGRHGLVRMLNSDWSDSFFHPYSPNIYALFAESHMNTAMALAVIPVLLDSFNKCKEKGVIRSCQLDGLAVEEIQKLKSAMEQYYEQLFQAFMKDMEGRVFAPRCYIGEHDEPELKFGMEHLCLEPQPFILQMRDFPLERKERHWQEIKARVLDEEKSGARIREKPLWDPAGHGEDGGIWFSHQGALITGLASLNKAEAYKLLKRLTFHHYAEIYPEYWVGHWTYADSLESTLSGREGLYHFWTSEAFQPFCAHAHAWMLYGYQRIREEERR